DVLSISVVRSYSFGHRKIASFLLGPVLLRQQDVLLPTQNGSNRAKICDCDRLAESHRDHLGTRSCSDEEPSLGPQEHVHPVGALAAVYIIDRVGPGRKRTHTRIAHAQRPAATLG